MNEQTDKEKVTIVDKYGYSPSGHLIDLYPDCPHITYNVIFGGQLVRVDKAILFDKLPDGYFGC